MAGGYLGNNAKDGTSRFGVSGALWVVRQPGLEPGELSGVVSGQLLNISQAAQLIEGLVVEVFGLAFGIQGYR